MNRNQYIPLDLQKLTESTNELIIPNNVFNTDDVISFNISNNGGLKRIVIGDNCFGKVRVFDLDGLSELESVVIGQKSFTTNPNEPWNNKRSDGDYRILNCPKLKSIQIGDTSFTDYHSFELSSLPTLYSIDIGGNCFFWTPSFSSKG